VVSVEAGWWVRALSLGACLGWMVVVGGGGVREGGERVRENGRGWGGTFVSVYWGLGMRGSSFLWGGSDLFMFIVHAHVHFHFHFHFHISHCVIIQ
jgi:hypothetical protein